MKARITRTLFSVAALGLAAVLTQTMAQSPVDIGLFQQDGELLVKVRPQADFDGIPSAIVFTIRWDKNTGASLGNFAQPADAAQYLPVQFSGGVREDGSNAYQVFAGFGFDRLMNTGQPWEAGEEYTIVTIPVIGQGEFQLVNDAWTAVPQNNADFYMSLGGRDMTGVIYKSSALVALDLENSVVIQPNPNSGQFTFSFVVSSASDVHVEMLNTLGQNVFNETLRNFEGNYNKEMDLTKMSNGIYYLKLSDGSKSSVHKIVYR